MKTKGIYFLYRLLQAFALPALLLYFFFRGLRNRAYWRSLPERFGFLPRSLKQTSPGAIWLHAVSVGEVLACLELARSLRRQFPQAALLVSTSTLAGRQTAEQKLKDIASGVFYAPVDYVFVIRRLLRALRPSVVVVAETEIWPNLFRETRRTGAGILIVNGRISDRALPRYLRFRRFFAAALPQLDTVLAQSAEMRARFLALGAAPETTVAAGNLKYDFDPRAAAPGSPAVQFVEAAKPARVWIAASTVAPAEAGDVDEDDAVISAFQQLSAAHPGLLLILVPRKPERFDLAAQKLAAAGVAYTRRTALPAPAPALPHVLLLDSIGELSGLFGLADVVFMGGTLARRGGHNILEPALFGKPVVRGPHMENFQDIADEFTAEGSLVTVESSAHLAGAVGRLLADPRAAAVLGERAKASAQARRGAGARAVRAVRGLYEASVPVYRPAQPWLAVAGALARVWEAGGRRRQRRAIPKRLDAPVVSVGNLTMGGTGKTPCALRLAEGLKRAGRAPGILTRGYGRSSLQKQLVVAPGATVAADHTGDEPQIFIRSGVAPVGIGLNRFEAGRLLLEQFSADILLLDDGFQHTRLARELDLVLVDALEPFGRGGVFPLGRLREPLSAFSRAGAAIITRSQYSDLGPAIEATLRRCQPDLPVFYAGVRAEAWVNAANGARFPVEAPPFANPGAFCGLGNPASFRRTLEGAGAGAAPLVWVEYEDHHRYRPSELRRLAHMAAAAGCQALLTTEKDSINLCEGWQGLLAPLPLYWLKVGMWIEREEELLRLILERAPRRQK